MTDSNRNGVGKYLKSKREAIRLSQRGLGLLFQPPVTTQFISNIERGVTPLPPIHVPTLVRALQIPERELLALLEREYSAKIALRAGRVDGVAGENPSALAVLPSDVEFMKKLYEAYRTADSKTQQTFVSVCETILNIPKKP